ncbi:MAG: Peptidase S24-like [Bacteroidota bacterium]|jgi:signal peptidase I
MLTEHVVSGYSMFPTLKPGDRVLLNPQHKNIKKGDIVAFFVGHQKAVLHRVHIVQDEKLFCKGDANTFWDVPVSAEQILGVLEMVRKSDDNWRQASSYQKKLYLTRYYGFYARMVRRAYLLLANFKVRINQSFK